MKRILLSVLAVLWGMTAFADGGISVTVTDRYKYYDQNKPGRLLYVSAADGVTSAKVAASGKTSDAVISAAGDGKYELILPEGLGVSENDTVSISLFHGKKAMGSVQAAVPKMRHWNILIFPHSHVDIGYTHPQDVVEYIHKQNIEQAIILGEKTKDYPEGARFVWNTEVAWPLERYLATEPKEKCDRVMEGIRKGYVSVDASYVNTNTTSAHEAEIIEMFGASHRIAKLTGKEISTMIQVDIPGFSWGIPAIAELAGIHSIISLPNGGDRIGRARNLDYHPRVWTGPDGKSKVLFIQPGPYTDAACRKRDSFFWDMLGQKDPTKLPVIFKSDNPRDMFVDDILAQRLPALEEDSLYIYDSFPMSWCMSDNVPIDTDLPDAVKSWNEEYAYPHLQICSSRDIIAAFEPYMDKMPVVSGDYTEYWTDGLGTSAHQTAHHRDVKEKISQAEVIGCMTGATLPQDEINETWRNVIMGTEHTWAYIWPDEPSADDILAKKFRYFTVSDSLATDLAERALSPCISKGSDIIAVFNTEGYSRGGLIKIAPEVLGSSNAVQDLETGEKIPSQILSDGSLAFVSKEIAPESIRKYRLIKEKAASPKTAQKIKIPEPGTIEDGSLSVTVDPRTGDIISLKKDGREFADNASSTEINSYRYLHGNSTSGFASRAFDVKLSWKEYGPVVKTLSIVSAAEGCESLTREITLVAGDGLVHINNIVDKTAILDKEGVHFGFAFNLKNKCRVRADVPWGEMELEKDQWPEGNRNWMAMQRWVNISDDDANVTICSLNAPIFELGDLTANILGSGEPDMWIDELKPVPCVWSWVMNNHWHTNFALSQDGKTSFRYVLNPEVGKLDIAEANRFARSQTRELVACPVAESFTAQMPFSLKADPSVEIASIKPVEGGMVVFLHSWSENDTRVEFSLQGGHTAAPTDAWGEKTGKPSTEYSIPAKSVIAVLVK